MPGRLAPRRRSPRVPQTVADGRVVRAICAKLGKAYAGDLSSSRPLVANRCTARAPETAQGTTDRVKAVAKNRCRGGLQPRICWVRRVPARAFASRDTALGTGPHLTTQLPFTSSRASRSRARSAVESMRLLGDEIACSLGPVRTKPAISYVLVSLSGSPHTATKQAGL